MDLDPIEARANAATEGPWEHDGLTLWGRDDIGRIKVGSIAASSSDDRAFIVAARTDVPALVARVRELEEENQKLRTAACTRCEGSAVDPEDSCPGSYGGYDTEPPSLEPCRDCVIPDGIARKLLREEEA